MEIATIGFTQSSAEHFFRRLKDQGVRRVVDIRLHNASQLAGFSKGPDLAYFLKEICGATYEHDLRLAPTEALLGAAQKGGMPWNDYEPAFLALIHERGVLEALDPKDFEAKTALLCSEATPTQCHRRLIAEALSRAWGAEIHHL